MQIYLMNNFGRDSNDMEEKCNARINLFIDPYYFQFLYTTHSLNTPASKIKWCHFILD